MKKIKYVLIAILILMGLFLIGEYNVLRVLHALENSYPHISFDFDGDWRDASEEIIATANQNNVVVFSYNNNYTSLM
ncbi:MAG: hypothetical protein LBD23_10275 [Oscillospiraceae bacterium]|jgi:hypothetical protein|nr:hypothetical protein [Oscillospiraceae bacterium]